jgi:hypothetical protein
MADGNRSTMTEAVKLHVKLSFSWEHEFKILKGGPFPVILGLDSLRRTGMSMDVSLREYCFGFAPSEKGKFSLEVGTLVTIIICSTCMRRRGITCSRKLRV